MNALNVSRRTLVYIAIVLVVAASVLVYAYDRNGGSLDFSDTQVRIVISGSMDGEPREQYDIETIPVESMVFIREVPEGAQESDSFYRSLEVGDVLTFNYVHPFSKEFMVVTHRIIEIEQNGSGFTYILKGDSIADDPTNGSIQEVTSQSGDIIGKVVGVAPWLGSLVVFLSTMTGKLCLIIIPCAILIVSEVRNIVRILRKGDDGEEVEKGDEVPCDDAQGCIYDAGAPGSGLDGVMLNMGATSSMTQVEGVMESAATGTTIVSASDNDTAQTYATEGDDWEEVLRKGPRNRVLYDPKRRDIN